MNTHCSSVSVLNKNTHTHSDICMVYTTTCIPRILISDTQKKNPLKTNFYLYHHLARASLLSIAHPLIQLLGVFPAPKHVKRDTFTIIVSFMRVRGIHIWVVCVWSSIFRHSSVKEQNEKMFDHSTANDHDDTIEWPPSTHKQWLADFFSSSLLSSSLPLLLLLLTTTSLICRFIHISYSHSTNDTHICWLSLALSYLYFYAQPNKTEGKKNIKWLACKVKENK